MAFYTTERLGATRGLTPEGYLIIRDVPLARTGVQLYTENEVPVKGNWQGHVRIARDAAEVFRPETIASLQGKPITVDHPEEDISPENYRKLAVGHVINPHQGKGQQAHLLLGDLMIWCSDAMESINSGQLREVSVGYDADYQETGDGMGRQHNIIANHLALVQDGRCGPICRIGDALPQILKGVRTTDCACKPLQATPAIKQVRDYGPPPKRKPIIHIHL